MADEFETAGVQETAAPVAEPSETETPPEGQKVATEPEASAAAEQPETVESLRDAVAALTKERNDLKGQSVGRQRAADRQAEITDELASMRKLLNAFLVNQTSGGDPQALKSEIETIQSEAAKQAVSRSWDTAYEKASGMLTDALYDGDTRVLDPNGPELKETREAWLAARKANDREGLLEAVHLANVARRKYDRQAAAKPAPKAEEPQGADLDMALPSGGQAAGERTRFTREDLASMTPEQYAKARTHLLKQ
jgi:hypothetical protein